MTRNVVSEDRISDNVRSIATQIANIQGESDDWLLDESLAMIVQQAQMAQSERALIRLRSGD